MTDLDALEHALEFGLTSHALIYEYAAPHTAVIIDAAPTLIAEHRAALARVAELEGVLHKYADTLCEHSTCFEGCGKLSADQCGGCPARAALEAKP